MDKLAADYDSCSGDDELKAQAAKRQRVEPEDEILCGSKVSIHGLATEAGAPFNGKTATVLEWRREAERFHVQLKSGGTINLKHQNVTVLDEDEDEDQDEDEDEDQDEEEDEDEGRGGEEGNDKYEDN